MSAVPTVPPRPTRHQHAAAAGASKLPEIPPRPPRKRLESSPSRELYAQSPLNEIPGTTNLGRVTSRDASSTSLPPRPPSVTLPSIGQEGNEYADLEYGSQKSPETEKEPTTSTRNIGGDLPMHAPKPSLPHSSAKAQVQAVTRTDSSQATALGFGPSSTHAHEETEPSSRSIRSKASFSRPTSSASVEHRRNSVAYDDEQGPAELGMRVPINPALGDVQAPSPAPGPFHAPNGRRHARTKSGRTVFLPPDSYGLHAHGVQVMDKFDKEWYAKHPDAYAHDESQGHYAGIGSGRGEWAMSSDDLNKIVRDTASRGAGFGGIFDTYTTTVDPKLILDRHDPGDTELSGRTDWLLGFRTVQLSDDVSDTSGPDRDLVEEVAVQPLSAGDRIPPEKDNLSSRNVREQQQVQGLPQHQI